MTKRTAFLIEFLARLATPLAAAVQDVSSRAAGAGEGRNPAQDAETMAALLGQAVRAGMATAETLGLSAELKDTAEEGDAARLALAALSSPLIADFYRINGRPPGDGEAKRAARTLEALLAFAGNYTPTPAHVARLKSADGTVPFFDPLQSQIYYLSSMAPVLSAVAEFPFGQAETKLVQDIARALDERAAALLAALSYPADGEEGRFSMLLILSPLASLYAECHRAETRRILAAGAGDGAALSLEPVWKAFDLRLSMLNALAAGVSGKETPPAAVSPAAPEPSIPVPAVTAPAAAASSPAAGPMGFFKK